MGIGFGMGFSMGRLSACDEHSLVIINGGSD
jgi:hypothetical protein